MFIISLQKLGTPILVKFDRELTYRMIDVLAGGSGSDYTVDSNKEITQIELGLIKEICLKLIDDLNEAWSPIYEIKAKYVRAEVNAEFIGIVSAESKVIKVDYKIGFNNVTGVMEIIYPYSTLFPIRNELFTSV